MKSINAGIFGDDSSLLSLLGKKGTDSDIMFSNRKDGNVLYTFMESKNKLSAKAQIMQVADIAIIKAKELSAEFGETILMLDAIGKKNGIIIPEFVDENVLSKAIKGTVAESYKMTGKDFAGIMDAINSFEIVRKDSGLAAVEVDHFFNVKGVGTVILGFVKSGTVKRHDKLIMLPQGKKVTVRSIQMHDKDFDEAVEGSRVGLAIKEADAEEFLRGAMLCKEGFAASSAEFEINFFRIPFYKGEITEGKVFHMSIGMQFFPATIKSLERGRMKISAEKKIVITPKVPVLLFDLNARGVHLAAKGNTA